MRPYYNYISLLFNVRHLKASFLKLYLTSLSIPLFVFSTIAISQTPIANFSADKVSGCSPLTVKFTDLSTNIPTSWVWDFGNGQLSSLQNPTVNFSTPGTYTVKLIARNTSGIDEEEKINYITVFPAPAASFRANITTACVPATIQFTDLSTSPPNGGTITSWSWNFGDGGTSTSQNPSHQYTAAGFYTVSLLITSSTGCQSYAAFGRYIRIINGIDADFVYSQPTTCQGPFSISFQDQSSGPGTLSYLWNFGSGSPSSSTISNPTVIYASPGTYPVQLSVQSDLGCNGTITKNIVVAGKTTDFTAPASICLGQSVTFQNNSSPPPSSSLWDFGDGTISSQINPTKTYLSGGTFQVRLINNYGNCIDSITKTVTVNTQPPVNFTANDSTSCKTPFTVQFSDLSPSASTWLWDFGDGTTATTKNPSHTYNSMGLFTVTLTITLPGGCSNTITKYQYIKISPTIVRISNAPNGGCIPFTFQPIASIQSVDSVLSYSWNLGAPGAIYSTQSPTHTYTSAGNYNLQLTITTQNGCVETVNIPNGVLTGTPPIVKFDFTPTNNACASSGVQFNDLSITSLGATVRWLWDFGDSLISVLQSPMHFYVDTGLLNVKLVVSNNGCIDSLIKPIQIKPPVAKFGYQVNCNNKLEVTFLDSSLTNSVYGPISYLWDFGDGSPTLNSLAPTHIYPSFNTYMATLTVTNGLCPPYITTKEIKIINEIPAFTSSKNTVCKGETFTLSATGNAANIKDYTWTIGAFTLRDTTRNIDFSLANYGPYDVKLIIEDINGCMDSVTMPNFITVSGPIADFTPNGNGACVNKAMSFNDLSTPTSAPITQWTWNFGDGTQQSFPSSPFSHVYSLEGSYSVSLIVKDNVNCADTFAIANAVLITNPKAAFYADTFFCPSAPLQFTDTSSGVGGLTYNWYFGDGGTSTLRNPTHNYLTGNYDVKLKIRDLAGCEDSVTKIGYIKIRKPVAAFSMVDSTGICLPLQTSFNFQGSNYASFSWDFGDGSTSSLQNPSHFYSSYGTYIPKLYVEGPGGCVDSAQSVVNAYNPYDTANIKAIFAPTSDCDSIVVNFTITVPPGFKYVFYFGDGKLDSTRQTNLTHKYTGPGNYYPYMIIPDKYGCETFIPFAPVYVYGALPLFGIDKKEFCDNGQATFTNYTLSNDPITSTVWDFGDGNSSTASDPSHNYTAPGTYLIRLSVNTQQNCPSSFVDTVRVYRTPVVSITGKDTVCLNTPETFLGSITQSDSTIKWLWNFGNGSSSQLQNGVTGFSNSGNYNIQLIASNKLGCADTAFHPVNAVPTPTAIPASDPITILSGGDAQLNMNYTGAIISYNWIPSQNLSCDRCPNPLANPQFTTKYSVTISDRYGCTSKGYVTVRVVCNGQNFFMPNTFSPNGDGSNDIFYPRGSGLDRAKTLRIFNRWGEVVFEKYDMPINAASAGWDGTWKGKKADAGVYVYQLEIYCKNGELISYTGNITLIR